MAVEIPSFPISILADMQDRSRPRRGPLGDVERHPEPDEKPDPHAQWDEAAGRWEVWDDDAGGWVSLTDGTVQPPGTGSVDSTGAPVVYPDDEQPA
jgi:hypothetical protein